MTWREKSVTVNERSSFTFRSVLGDVTVDEDGIRREQLQREDDWELIREDMPDDEIFTGFLPWRRIESVSKQVDFLTYPHIDIELDDEIEDEREDDSDRFLPPKIRIFFKDNDHEQLDQVEKCFKTIRIMWNAYRQKNKLHFLSYSYNEEEDVERVERPQDEGAGEDGEEDSDADQEDEADREEDGSSIEELVDTALDDPGELMDKLGS